MFVVVVVLNRGLQGAIMTEAVFVCHSHQFSNAALLKRSEDEEAKCQEEYVSKNEVCVCGVGPHLITSDFFFATVRKIL